MGISASGYGLNDYTGLSYNGNPVGKTNKTDGKNSENEKKNITASDFRAQIEKFVETNKITSQDLKDDKDWRKISDDEWEDMLAGVDEKIDAYKEYLEHMKELKQEVARKAALEADSDIRATAAASASLNAEASGTVGVTNDSSKEGGKGEKNWTKNLDTDDQTVLRTAKAAQEMESKAIAKYNEIQNVEAQVVSRGKTVPLLGSKDDEGNIVVGFWGDGASGIGTTLYKPADLSHEDQAYLMRIKDNNSNIIEERRINFEETDIKNCDIFDMYAYSFYLSDTGKYPNALNEFYNLKPDENSNLYEKQNWISVLKDNMDVQNKLGNYQGYQQKKAYYDYLIGV